MAAGKELKRLRTGAGLSVAKFATCLSVDPERLRNWERRDSSPIDRSDINAIQDYFELPITKLHTIESFEIRSPKKNSHINQDSKIIQLLEDKVRMQDEQISFLKTQLLQGVNACTSMLMTNQDLLIDVSAHTAKTAHGKIVARAGKANAANFEKVLTEKGKMVSRG